MPSFSPDLLECLATLVEEGSFDRAAKRLSITQSAVSQRLHVLETRADAILIVRGRPLTNGWRDVTRTRPMPTSAARASPTVPPAASASSCKPRQTPK